MNSRWLDRNFVAFPAFVKENQGAMVQGGANKRGRRCACASLHRRLGLAKFNVKDSTQPQQFNLDLICTYSPFTFYTKTSKSPTFKMKKMFLLRINRNSFACHSIGHPPSNTHLTVRTQPVSILSSSTRSLPSHFCLLPTLPYASSSTLLRLAKEKAISNRPRNDSGTPIKAAQSPSHGTLHLLPISPVVANLRHI